jgi:citrate synthase
MIAKMPTLAAFTYRHSLGLPYAYPDNDLGYAANFLNMMFKATELKHSPNPALVRAIDVLFILHADHEQNYGPLHGGANEAVLRMLREIGTAAHVPAFIKRVKAGEGRLMGFGHRVYKNYDPRARIIKQVADDVFAVTKPNPLLSVALELERLALADDYFVTRKLYPNVDFYSGLVYQAIGLPVDMFPVLFAIPRTAGWLAQWLEMIGDPEQKIARPRQLYLGAPRRDYVPVDGRG